MRELVSPFLIGIGQTAAVLVYLLRGDREAFRERPVRGLYTAAFYLLLSLTQARLHTYITVSGMGSLPTLPFLALSWLLYALFLLLWSRASWEICCFLAFVLLLLVLWLFSRLLDLVAKLPGLKQCNALGGAIFGGLKALLLLLVFAWVVRYLGVIVPQSLVEETVLLRFFVNLI